MNAVGTWALIAEALIAILGGGGALWRFAINQGRREAKIDRVLRQVEPNGGSSLRDDVVQLRREVKELRGTQVEINGRLQTLERR